MTKITTFNGQMITPEFDILFLQVILPTTKSWNLEDDDDDDDNNGVGTQNSDSEEDPLDAFMKVKYLQRQYITFCAVFFKNVYRSNQFSE